MLSRDFVDPLGLEPRMTVPKTGVLPLHHGSRFSFAGAKIKILSLNFILPDMFFSKKSIFDS